MDGQNAPAAALTKSGFAQLLGVSKARVTQLVELGLPVTANGRIPRSEGLAWYEANVTPHRRKGLRAPTPVAGARGELEALKVERERLFLARERGELVARADVARAAFARGRADRDALLAWASRVSAPLAAELGADPAATFSALDRLAREHLAERAATPLDGLADD